MTTAESVARWHTSYHEAAHCCVASLLGVRVLRAKVHLKGGGVTEYIPGFETVADLKVRIATLAAGWSAEQHVTPGRKDLFGWSGDYESIEQVVRDRLGDSVPASERHTAHIYVCYSRVLVAKYWDRISRLAKMLFDYGRIDGEQVREVMAGAAQPTPEDHEQALRMAAAADWGKK